MTTTPATTRLVNCSTAWLVTNRHGSHLEFGSGADGIPERALAIAARTAPFTTELATGEVVGIRITDVITGEAWLATL